MSATNPDAQPPAAAPAAAPAAKPAAAATPAAPAPAAAPAAKPPAAAPAAPAASLDQFLAANPEAQAQYRKLAEAAAKKAVADREAEIARTAEEADLSEAGKARAELERVELERDGHKARADKTEVELGFSNAIVEAGLQLAGESARGMLQTAAAVKVAAAKELNVELSYADAIKLAVEDSPFLVKTAQATPEGAKTATEGAGAGEAPRLAVVPSTGGAPAPRPAAAPKVAAPVDTSKLSPEALAEYMQEQYGISG